jgi:hypothetical protein
MLSDELRKVQRLGGDTYSSAEVLSLIGKAADEIERLRAALRPFAKMADQVEKWKAGTGSFEGSFDANDLYRARDLLKK